MAARRKNKNNISQQTKEVFQQNQKTLKKQLVFYRTPIELIETK